MTLAMKHWGDWFVTGRWIWRRDNKEGLHWMLPVEFDSKEDAQKVASNLNEQERLNEAYRDTGHPVIYREWYFEDDHIFRAAVGATDAYVLPLSATYKKRYSNFAAWNMICTLIAMDLNRIEEQNKEDEQ